MMEEELESYILKHISAEPEYLRNLARETALTRLYSRMCSGHLQGRILKMLTMMINPKRILELGAYTGYSTLCFAEGSSPSAEIVSIEVDDEMEESLKKTFADTPYNNKINLIIGDALKIIPGIEGEFDMVFIDANKRNYPEYLELVLPKVRTGGFIIADNTLWDGKVASEEKQSDAQTSGIRTFNDMVVNNRKLETVIIPLRDGLTLIRKK